MNKTKEKLLRLQIANRRTANNKEPRYQKLESELIADTVNRIPVN